MQPIHVQYHVQYLGCVLAISACGVLALIRLRSKIISKASSVGERLGSCLDLVRTIIGPGSVKKWIVDQAAKRGSGMVQIFPIALAGPPSVMLVNLQETIDIFAKKGDDFDVAPLRNEIFRGFMPRAAISHFTDNEYKSIRQLTRDLMSPGFLAQVSGPKIYAQATKLVGSWERKATRAKGRPWDATSDLERLQMNVAYSVMLGDRGLADDEDIDASISDVAVDGGDSSLDEPVVFHQDPLPKLFEASRMHSKALPKAALGSPRLVYSLCNLFRSWRSSLEMVDGFVANRAAALAKELGLSPQSRPESHFEMMMQRARGKGVGIGMIKDEVYSQLLGCYDTIPHVLSWAMLYLGRHQRFQGRLRASLRAAYPAASSEARLPRLEEMMDGRSPLLDACIEEVIRCRPPISFILREATRDTAVFGRAVPKGTQLFIPTSGPGLTQPPIHDGDSDSEGATDKHWESPEAFDPDR